MKKLLLGLALLLTVVGCSSSNKVFIQTIDCPRVAYVYVGDKLVDLVDNNTILRIIVPVGETIRVTDIFSHGKRYEVSLIPDRETQLSITCD